MNNTKKTNPQNAELWSQDTNVPYGRRSVSSIATTFIAIALFLGFLYWMFLMPDDTATNANNNASMNAENNQTVAMAQQDDGKNMIERFFESIFSGAQEGLETPERHNAFNGADTDNTASAVASGAPLEQMVKLEQNFERYEDVKDPFEHSINDVIGKSVIGQYGDTAGEIHDVIVDRQTGEASAIIVNEESIYYERDLISLNFDDIVAKEANGPTLSSLSDNQIESKEIFSYEGLDKDRFISLKLLKEGQLLDFEGNIVGSVSTVIYRNAEAQNIYFLLAPKMVDDGQDRLYKIAFDEAQIVENKDGLDLKLTSEQTLRLAEQIYNDQL